MQHRFIVRCPPSVIFVCLFYVSVIIILTCHLRLLYCRRELLCKLPADELSAIVQLLSIILYHYHSQRHTFLYYYSVSLQRLRINAFLSPCWFFICAKYKVVGANRHIYYCICLDANRQLVLLLYYIIYSVC
ncbi:unnamed protein product [Aphis gossypii]|uniref:Uncharacterized protein n=1 Tax=Aphis gossypii TaxID=80765 RepID=A0A9P0JFX5_APHGO|nr:unnamed protein product [Aphis gossypii]